MPPLTARTRDAQVLADPVGDGIDDLSVPGDCAGFAVGGIPEDGMPPALAKKLASMGAEVTDEIGPLHSTGTANDSRTTW